MYLKHANMGCLKLNTIPQKEGLEKRSLRLEKGLETDFSCFKSCFNSFTYRFQGQETDKEWLGGAVSYKYRVHDARIGRFLSVDPLAAKYPFYSQYAFSGNRVIDAVELEGLEPDVLFDQQEWEQSWNSWADEITKIFGDKSEEMIIVIVTNEELQAVVVITAGVVLVVVTAGAAAPAVATAFAVTSGTMAVVGGIAKIVLHLADEDGQAALIPTSFIDATLGIVVQFSLEGTEYEEYIEVTRDAFEITEGLITLNPSSLSSQAQKATSLTLSSITLIDSGKEFIEDMEELNGKDDSSSE